MGVNSLLSKNTGHWNHLFDEIKDGQETGGCYATVYKYMGCINHPAYELFRI
jgi:hypothetical protein